MKSKNHSKIDYLLKIMKRLRDPVKGCPWDKKQTLESIIPLTIEEVYEVSEQIHNKDYVKLKEELGDLLFQVIYLSQIAKERNKFNFNHIVSSVTNKMIKRHPHVFKNKKFKNSDEFRIFWEKSKNHKSNGLLDSIPSNFPAIIKAFKIQKKVANVGFDYKNKLETIDKVIEEAKELKLEIKKKNYKKINEELGDLIFASLDVARKLNVHPENILAKANNKFISRWRKVEKIINQNNQNIKNLSTKDLNNLWKRIK